MQETAWRNQDVLHLSVDQWIEVLQNPSIFNEDALKLVCFVYRQEEHRSTASDIANSFSTTGEKVHYNKICAYNRRIAKELYKQYKSNPPINTKGERRFWNAVFDGELTSPEDSKGHFFWKLRPNLISAIEQLNLCGQSAQVEKYFTDMINQNCPKKTEAEEGAEDVAERKFRKRCAALIAEKKRLSDYRCEVCGMSFHERYGDRGKGYIIVHHQNPIAMREKPSKTTLDDLNLVCYNCHAMLHHGNLLTVKQLRSIISRAQAQK
jgi:5-methylcytosine-specific restriction protein A